MDTEFFSSDFEIKSLSETGRFEGLAAVFHNKDLQQDIILPGAFLNSLDSHRRKGHWPHLLWQHQMHEPIGNFTNMYEDKKGLRVEGRLLIHEDATAKRAYAHLKNKSVRGLSVGFNSVSGKYDYAKGATLYDEIDLVEVSLVTRPANESAQVDAVKSALGSPRDMERFLRDVGLSRKQAKGLMSVGFKGVCPEGERDEELNHLLQTLKGITNGNR